MQIADHASPAGKVGIFSRCAALDEDNHFIVRKRCRIAFVVLPVMGVLALVVWAALRSPEPVYEGKRLSFWLKELSIPSAEES